MKDIYSDPSLQLIYIQQVMRWWRIWRK